jgi:hypothetical protein
VARHGFPQSHAGDEGHKKRRGVAQGHGVRQGHPAQGEKRQIHPPEPRQGAVRVGAEFPRGQTLPAPHPHQRKESQETDRVAEKDEGFGGLYEGQTFNEATDDAEQHRGKKEKQRSAAGHGGD